MQADVVKTPWPVPTQPYACREGAFELPVSAQARWPEPADHVPASAWSNSLRWVNASAGSSVHVFAGPRVKWRVAAAAEVAVLCSTPRGWNTKDAPRLLRHDARAGIHLRAAVVLVNKGCGNRNAESRLWRNGCRRLADANRDVVNRR